MARLKTAAIYIMSVSLCVMLIVYADTSTEAAAGAVKRCLNILIPSLFVFMAAAGIIIRSGAYKVLSLSFYPVAKYIFGIPYELFSVVLISNIAGFPVGASMLRELLDSGRIDRRTASLMQCFCFGGGPSFSVGVIGLCLFADKRAGFIICLSAMLANLTAALIICRVLKLRINKAEKPREFGSNDIIACTEKAGVSMLMICALIIIFCVIMADVQRLIAGRISIPAQAQVLISSVFEISGITALDGARIGFIPVIAGLYSFGGVCVLMQIAAAAGGKYSLMPFFITRLPISLISMAYAHLLCSHVYDEAVECLAVGRNCIVNFNNFVPSICLILMIFLLLFKKGVAFLRQM